MVRGDMGMNSVYLKIFTRFFLFTAFIFAVTGCGSSSSTANSATGSIAAKLVWSSQSSQKTAKTLYAAPVEVTSLIISVYTDASMTSLITSESFSVTPGAAGSRTLGSIPAGNGRAVKVEGLGTHAGLGLPGVLLYLGTATVNVVAGPTPTPVTITMEAPVTSASPATAPSATSFPVTLTTNVPATIYYTTNEPATIYYTTNGATPNTSSPNGISPVNLSVTPPLTLKFFAVVRGLYEAVTTITY